MTDAYIGPRHDAGALAPILAARRLQTEQAKALRPEVQLRRQLEMQPGPTNGQPGVARFTRALRENGPLAVIAELKRRSPSAGPIRPELDLGAQARAYTQAGAAALSVLTESAYFGGSAEDLERVALASRLPRLRKDFLTEPYHLYEAAALGADAVLLIVRILGDDQLRELLALAEQLGLAALVEVHDEEELGRAIALDATVIGINNRNLDTLVTDLQTVRRLAPLVPRRPGRWVVAESGYRTAADVADLPGLGIDAVLVGEALLRAADPAKRLQELRSAGSAAGARSAPALATATPPQPEVRTQASVRAQELPLAKAGPAPSVKVKICGLQDLAAAQAARAAGADALGFVFYPHSRRFLDLEAAQALVSSLRSLARDEGLPCPQLVGVFVRAPEATILHHVRALQLNVVQLHGNESPAFVQSLRHQLDQAGFTDTRLWLAVPCSHPQAARQRLAELGLGSRTAPPPVSAVLIDKMGPAPGGNGQPFTPEEFATVRSLREHAPHLGWGLAGGLRPGNVAAAIAAVRPDFVDVSSGVEIDGRKDPVLIRQFVQNAQQAFAWLETKATATETTAEAEAGTGRAGHSPKEVFS
ncbi:MAG: indole-3-glycerol phosphate synthase TrpC [Limnochordaceae bacterium]|nr:indole-3-glycerol phosphate synthase TrpC [Limnochordaceae bacterium]